MTAITADSPILHLKDYGQSVWMDNLSRDHAAVGRTRSA
jgi:hypothetical protein